MKEVIAKPPGGRKRKPSNLGVQVGAKPIGMASANNNMVTKNRVVKPPSVEKEIIARPTGPQAKKQFGQQFQKLERPERHKLVEKVMAKKFGKTNWREKVYGKNYKGGTVKGLNKDVKSGKEKGERIKGYLKEAQANLAKSQGTENQSGVEKRLKELTTSQAKTKATTEHKKEKRQTYLDRRNKALANIQATAKRNPAALKAGRKQLAEKKMDEVKKATERKEPKGKEPEKKKKKKATVTGGTEAGY